MLAHATFSFHAVAFAVLSPSSINQTYQVGDNVTLQCTSMGGPGNTYQWMFNGLDILEETSGTLTLANVTAADGGEYTCLVSDIVSASTHVFIAPYFLTQPMDITVHIESSGNLSCEAKAFPYPEYQWERVDGEPIRAGIVTNESTLLISSIMLEDEGDYFCNVISGETSVTSQDATILILLHGMNLHVIMAK